MTRSRNVPLRRHLLGLSVIVLVACSEPTAGPDDRAEPLFATSPGPVLVECPTDRDTAVSAHIGLDGGVLELDGHKLEIPAGAVVMTTLFTLRAPPSPYLTINIKAGGEESFEFRETVDVTLSYQRCTRSNIDKDSLEVWKIDPETKALIKNMGGTDYKDLRLVIFATDSLSEYSIAD